MSKLIFGTNLLLLFYFREWSDDGCWVQTSNTSHTICACNHLTNFAVVMEVTDVRVSSLNENTRLQILKCRPTRRLRF